MKLRNLISAVLLVGVGSTALPAAANPHATYPTGLPSNCSVTLTNVGARFLLDVRGNTTNQPQPQFLVTCTAVLPSWMTW